MLPPVIDWIRFGITGMMMPKPMTSMSSVTKMKPMAGVRLPIDQALGRGINPLLSRSRTASASRLGALHGGPFQGSHVVRRYSGNGQSKPAPVIRNHTQCR